MKTTIQLINNILVLLNYPTEALNNLWLLDDSMLISYSGQKLDEDNLYYNVVAEFDTDEAAEYARSRAEREVMCPCGGDNGQSCSCWEEAKG